MPLEDEGPGPIELLDGELMPGPEPGFPIAAAFGVVAARTEGARSQMEGDEADQLHNLSGQGDAVNVIGKFLADAMAAYQIPSSDPAQAVDNLSMMASNPSAAEAVNATAPTPPPFVAPSGQLVSWGSSVAAYAQDWIDYIYRVFSSYVTDLSNAEDPSGGGGTPGPPPDPGSGDSGGGDGGGD